MFIYSNSKITKTLMSGLLTCFLLAFSHAGFAQTNAIESISYSSLPGNAVQINIKLSEPVVKPLSFTINNPARIAFDFPNTVSKLSKRTQPIGSGIAESVTTITAKDKTRVILNLSELSPYKVNTQGNNVFVTLDSHISASPIQHQIAAANGKSSTVSGQRAIDNIDFRRGEKGEGRVIIKLSDPNIPMDVSEQDGKVIVRFIGAQLPEELNQHLDVIDFATPVHSIESAMRDNSARIEIKPINPDFEHLAYQTDKIFTVELKPISREELEEIKKDKFGYVGERLSLNFQDIPVRAVLQLIADFTGLNVVVSDSVDGNLTLRLKNVPWDQALDIILKAKGLDKRENGNVVLVAPSEEIAAQEKLELEAKQQVVDLAPLRTGYFQVNFAKVTELEKLFNSGDGKGIMSSRGTVIIDERTNSLLVKDTEEVLTEVRRVLTRLDVPVRQVLIESRIVIATDDFIKEMGVRFGTTYAQTSGPGNLSVSTGTFQGTSSVITEASGNIVGGDPISPLSVPLGGDPAQGGIGTDRLNVNLPAASATGSIAFAILSGGNLLDLELSAREAENTSEIIASPRVVTADRNEAFIESGVEIPYETTTSSGATQIAFKKAVLSIKVTPQITPDDRVILDLQVNKDAVGELFGIDQIPSIDTREVQTQVLVNNGDTVVLGGIYESSLTDELDKVPVLGDLPIIGSLFRHTLKRDEKAELLIFVTPKILKETLSL